MVERTVFVWGFWVSVNFKSSRLEPATDVRFWYEIRQTPNILVNISRFRLVIFLKPTTKLSEMSLFYSVTPILIYYIVQHKKKEFGLKDLDVKLNDSVTGSGHRAAEWKDWRV